MKIDYKITGKIGKDAKEFVLREIIITNPEGKEVLADYMIVYPKE